MISVSELKPFFRVMEVYGSLFNSHISKIVNPLLMLELVLNLNRQIMKLSELKQGDKRTIKGFESSDLELKLMEMGCLPGEEVVVEQIAPLGDPISIKVAGYLLSLRLNEAKHIIVE